jgi:hypothetical protein
VFQSQARLDENCRTESKSPTEKRRHSRKPARDLSEIILNGNKTGIACLIHDVSDAGARLEVSCGELPKRFVLANYTKQTKTLCQLVWREGRSLGVNFLSAPRAFTIDRGFTCSQMPHREETDRA